MQMLIPMAGEGSRFSAAGYSFPKPLIEVCGKPMIQVVLESLGLTHKEVSSITFLVRKEHLEKYQLKSFLNRVSPVTPNIVVIDKLTEGAACTTLLAKNYINNNVPLLIANSDQYIKWDKSKLDIDCKSSDGAILTFKATHPKWSYARVHKGYPSGTPPFREYVVEVAEKNPISDRATVGVYYWKSGAYYVKYAEQMIAKNIRTNNEFYVCPVFNEAIADGFIIEPLEVEEMWGLGTPEDLRYFESKHDTI